MNANITESPETCLGCKKEYLNGREVEGYDLVNKDSRAQHKQQELCPLPPEGDGSHGELRRPPREAKWFMLPAQMLDKALRENQTKPHKIHLTGYDRQDY